MNRREFFFSAAAGTISARRFRPVPPSDQVNVGVIGPGSRGQGDMRNMLRVPGVRITAICDVYEPRFAPARKIAGADTPTFTDYRRLLDQKDLDAILIATPLGFHADHVTAALASGRHVYCEKSQALTVPQCNQIVEAVKRSGKRYQIGFQYHYSPWFDEVLRQIKAGKIGRVMQVHSYWHRNNSWRRPVPDPKDQKLERLINWRMYREYSAGMLAELGSHHIEFVNRIFEGMPESVVGSGGIDYWKDGREVYDNLDVIYRYRGGQTHLFSSTTTNRLEGAQIKIFGTQGSVVLTHADAVFFDEAPTAESAVLLENKGVKAVTTGPSMAAEAPYRGQGHPVELPKDAVSADHAACRAFFESVRNNTKPDCDEHVGFKTTIPVLLGNMAIDKGSRIRFADHVRT